VVEKLSHRPAQENTKHFPSMKARTSQPAGAGKHLTDTRSAGQRALS
jgi:hypothetical protein